VENISFGDNTDQFLIGNTISPRRTSLPQQQRFEPGRQARFFETGRFKSGGLVNLGFDFDNSLIGFGGINAGRSMAPR